VSVTGGESRAIEPPEYEIRGKTTFDQRWIDETIESGVQGLGWDRPKTRPPELDAAPTPQAPTVAKPAQKKPSIWKRAKARLLKKPVS
jgi:hypothetical protein